METRKLNVMINKTGTKNETSVNHRVSIPNAWARKMGIDKENRVVEVIFDGEQIIIKKS